MYTETLALVECRKEGKEIFTYVFQPEHPVAFEAGQYAHIRVPSLPMGTRRVHEFSFASAPQDSELWFGVDARSGSAYQKALQSLEPGDVVELFKIRGHLTWPSPVSDIVMIAGGVGVTPFRSMLRDARSRNLVISATLLHVAREEYLYTEELKGLTDEYLTIRRPLLVETLASVAFAHPDAHYYIAGSANFVETVASELSNRGVSKVESDEFKGLIEE